MTRGQGFVIALVIIAFGREFHAIDEVLSWALLFALGADWAANEKRSKR